MPFCTVEFNSIVQKDMKESGDYYVRYSDGYYIIINNFLQNHFIVGDDESSSEGDSNTKDDSDGNTNDDGDGNTNDDGDGNTNDDGGNTAQQPAATEARRGLRAKMPRNFFQAGW